MKKSSIFGLVVIAIAIAVIVSIYGSASTFSNFAEAKEKGGMLQVSGKLDKQKELYYDAKKDANYFSFYAIDEKGDECKVVLNNTKPQDFEKSETLVMTGQMMPNGEFHAKSILMKCPSKYTQDKVEITEVKAKEASL